MKPALLTRNHDNDSVLHVSHCMVFYSGVPYTLLEKQHLLLLHGANGNEHIKVQPSNASMDLDSESEEDINSRDGCALIEAIALLGLSGLYIVTFPAEIEIFRVPRPVS